MQQYQCPHCGAQFSTPQPIPTVHCPTCGREFQASTAQGFSQGTGPQQAQYSTSYGPQYSTNYGPQQPGIFDEGPSGKSRGVAALLAILLGSFGIHYFYLDKATGGLICILLSFVTCGVWYIIMLIQGILFLTMKQEDFERKYVTTASSMPIF